MSRFIVKATLSDGRTLSRLVEDVSDGFPAVEEEAAQMGASVVSVSHVSLDALLADALRRGAAVNPGGSIGAIPLVVSNHHAVGEELLDEFRGRFERFYYAADSEGVQEFLATAYARGWGVVGTRRLEDDNRQVYRALIVSDMQA